MFERRISLWKRCLRHFCRNKPQLFSLPEEKYNDCVVCAFDSSHHAIIAKERIYPDHGHWKVVMPYLAIFWTFCLKFKILFSCKNKTTKSSSNITREEIFPKYKHLKEDKKKKTGLPQSKCLSLECWMEIKIIAFHLQQVPVLQHKVNQTSKQTKSARFYTNGIWGSFQALLWKGDCLKRSQRLSQHQSVLRRKSMVSILVFN